MTESQRYDGRRGVTLLEVLIAIMVLAVGLLGLASLLPVGSREMARANQADRVGAMGREAIRDLVVRGALNPTNWLFANGAAAVNVIASANGTVSSFVTPPGLAATSVPPFAPIVLDPLMIATNTNSANVVQTFPYKLATGNTVINAAPPIARMTLRAMPSATTSLSVALAERIFRSTDDVAFTLPNNNKLYKPIGSYEIGLPVVSASYIARRKWTGDISWFATIQPDIAEASPVLATLPVAPGWEAEAGSGALTTGIAGALQVRQFTVAVAACFKREIADVSTLNSTGPYTPTAERIATIYFPNATATNTTANASDAWLFAADLNKPSDQAAAQQYLTVQPDQWIMVTGQGTASNGGMSYVSGATPKPQVVLYWYRVRSASSDLIPPSNSDVHAWARLVRLEGPDWPLAPTGFTSGFATIVNGVVGVYQKTIVLDRTSAWAL
ncbi:MAG TPA: prepilin-type N-terminal cleavage/methylation domain-containing protein [Pirellulales bacterium]|jgi:prepilin-type N-terminal cleavage/methylation domain-containing protein|nr:prepilin-type N-terminal cleavage/methylation domain-containing protein [Pirellulales bacterium]